MTNIPTSYLGIDGDSWDVVVLWSLGIAALAAAFVVFATVGQVVSHKRETEAATRELAAYKLETEGKVAEAKTEGLNAGKAAGDALVKAGELQVQADALRIELAKANERASAASERAAQAEIKLEQIRAPRRVAGGDIPTFVSALSGYAGTKIDIMVLGEGPEPNGLGQQLADLLFSTPPGWVGLKFPWTGGGSAEGVLVLIKPGSSPNVSKIASDLANALTAAHIQTTAGEWPGNWDSFGGFTAGPAAPDAVMRVVIGTKPP
jgi:hypothetical protein